MQVWVTRDKDTPAVVVIWTYKPVKLYNINIGTYFGQRKDVPIETPMPTWLSTFKKIAGFTPRKGSCKQYNLTLTEVKE